MRCLLIAPLHFYHFAKRLADGLVDRGYEVDLCNEEYPTGLAGRVAGYFFTPLVRRTTYSKFSAMLEREGFFDLIVIIKGRGMSSELIRLFKEKCGRVVAYNYDSFKRNPAALSWFHEVENFRTFDFDDAKFHDLSLLHLYSDAPKLPTADRKYLVSVIQRVHSDRIRYASRIADAVPEHERFIFLYEWSLLTLIVGLLRSPYYYLRMWRYISFRPLPYSVAMEYMASSQVTFDFAFPGQSGITVRCFEAQSLSVGILTNNLSTVNSGVFDNGTIAFLPEDADPQTIRKLLTSIAVRPRVAKSRTLDDFLNELLAI